MISERGRSPLSASRAPRTEFLPFALPHITQAEIDEVADTLVLYRFGAVPAAAVRQAELIRDASLQLRDAIALLQSQNGLAPYWIEVHRLENEGDRVSRQAIGQLFSERMDAVELIRLKDLYTLLEDGLDRCEDVANVIESIVIKNA